MNIDAQAWSVIERKAALYDAARNEVMEKIRGYVEEAIEKLRDAEAELLGAVEIAFWNNPFSELLGKRSYAAESEVKSILSKEVLRDFGPGDEAFKALLSEIDTFKAQHRKVKRMLVDTTPRNLACRSVGCDAVSVLWDRVEWECSYEVEAESITTGEKSTYNVFENEYSISGLDPETEYRIRVRSVTDQSSSMCLWSDPITVKTEYRFSDYIWKSCPDNVDDKRKYSVGVNNPRIATKINDGGYCTIIGNRPLYPNRVVSWSIKLLKSTNNDGNCILVGVGPNNINQNDDDNYKKCGWYFDCYRSTLRSGPPHNYKYPGKEHGPKKKNGEYVHTGNAVGVVMDMIKGKLSFILNGVNYGVAYEGIPLDKPLVPCVLLKHGGNSVELDTSDAKENVNSSVPVPSNIIAKSLTWNSIDLTWIEVSYASFYQIETDGSKSWGASTANSFTKGGFLPESEHSFRVRTVRGNSVSEWSDVVKGWTTKKTFEASGWKECPDDVDLSRRYFVDGNRPRVATKVNYHSFCTIIGNTLIHLNTVTSWSIKVLKLKSSDCGIYIGVAPNDLNQDNDDNYRKCGWYFNYYYSSLYSGPPHNYSWRPYGPKKKNGEYVHTGNSVGVVVDTIKGELSFALDRVNLGVAYEGIPLDKPLVPCALLYYKGDSVELDTSEVKETEINSSIPVPSNIIAKGITWNSITLTWDNDNNASFYQIEVDGSKSWGTSTTNTFTKRGLLPETEHSFRVRTVRGSSVSEWSDVAKGRTLKASDFLKICAWKECPDDVDEDRKYDVDGGNPRIATKVFDGDNYCTIIGNTYIPLNTLTSWSVKILEQEDNNNGYDICIGVAPSDINQNANNNYDNCGWYFYCSDSTLWSGPPHSYDSKEYGPRKGDGQYVHTGGSVGVVVDTTKGDLSFVLNGVNLGVAFEGIPLDKPLVPCVILGNKGDSVELDTSGAGEDEVDDSIVVPSSIIAEATWNSITLIWNEVTNVTFYQIEVDGSKSWDATTTSTFIKRGLLPETEYSFRVRTVRGSLVSEWSDVVKGRTTKESFKTSGWKKCPDDVDGERRYHVDENNPRIATKINENDYCTIIGNTHIPLNTAASWRIKVLKSRDNDSCFINIGVAPSDINQSNDNNFIEYGWYFICHDSTLCSGPPHNYSWKSYGPKKKNGEYVHTGDSVGVVIDTIRGDLSFVLSGVNLGVAYEGIPLDKPLVPCAILGNQGDSVELDTTEVKENVDSSIHVPSNIIVESVTWGTLALTWGKVSGSSFYQIEVDGSKSWGASTTNAFTKGGFLPETEHSFRVRAVRGNSVSEWSIVVKGKTLKESFETSEWKECPDNIDGERRYLVDDDNPRIATKINSYNFCAIIGSTPIPLNTITSWSVKVLESKNNNGGVIYVGVAPFNINQNTDSNYKKCGWYFNCYYSSLYSGPPHDYVLKEYGPRKEKNEQYVHTGDSVGVVVDTTKGDLSFVLSGVNLGVAYEEIPLDKPLVPCVLLVNKGDSVELDTSEVKETEVDDSIAVPSNIIAEATWNSITLTWNEVTNVTFYQIEVDGSKTFYASTTNSFTKRRLLSETEYCFRVRTVRRSSVSKWSDVVKGRTMKRTFENSVWKKCPDDVGEDRKYNVDEKNPRIATKVNNDECCTIIGNTHIPPNTVTSWSIKVLKSEDNNGSGIWVGAAQNVINQNVYDNYHKCGWYFNCYSSTLYSGPIHSYNWKPYGPRKENGEYVHTGDSVGVMMDTTRGDLSFVLNGVNLGVAYEGIPLDKPLVPCVIIYYQGDSVELVI